MILGIDPGKSGGLAFITVDGRIESISPMPDLYRGWVLGLDCLEAGRIFVSLLS